MALSILERAKIGVLSTLAYWFIKALGSTLRWEVHGREHLDTLKAAGKTFIGVFWHGRILPSICWWHDRGIVVMTSQHRDGDYIAPVIQRFGFGSARGSSTRGSRGALIEMLHWLRHGHDVAFTIDGPRGPRYVAKPGAAWLASKSGSPLLLFNINAERKWILGSWDHFQIPKPFSRIVLIFAPLMYVKADAGEKELEATQQIVQSTLDDLLQRGDSYWEST